MEVTFLKLPETEFFQQPEWPGNSLP
jgi:hypothetical protein